MKQHRLAFVITLILLSCFACSLQAQTPGSAGDPLVTKSYIDHLLRFRSMLLPAKESISPEAGALIIVRSGQVILEAPKGKTVIDLTAGKEIASGKELPVNHLIIIPEEQAYKLTARKAATLLASFLSEKADSEKK